MTYLELFGLLSALPNDWHAILKDSYQEQRYSHMSDKMVQKSHISSFVYKKLTYEESILQTKIDKWQQELDMEVDYETFLRILLTFIELRILISTVVFSTDY